MPILDWLTTTALSFTISGNTGVSPFMSLFLVGIIEKTNPELLQMDGTIEWILSSWLSIIIWGALMCGEFVGKCIPVIDELIDSAMTFVVPIMSILGSLSTFGLFTAVNNGESLEDEGHRALSIASGALTFFRICIVAFGIVLALCLHGLKMLLRLVGTGCLTGCLTIMETTWVITTITLAVFVRQFAILIAILLCFGAGYTIKKTFIDKDDKANAAAEQVVGYNTMDEEQPQRTTVVATTTTTTTAVEGTDKTTALVDK